MNYPYQLVDPMACSYTSDMSYCPKVQNNNGECPKDCDCLVTIKSLKDAIAFDEYIDQISGDEE